MRMHIRMHMSLSPRSYSDFAALHVDRFCSRRSPLCSHRRRPLFTRVYGSMDQEEQLVKSPQHSQHSPQDDDEPAALPAPPLRSRQRWTCENCSCVSTARAKKCGICYIARGAKATKDHIDYEPEVVSEEKGEKEKEAKKEKEKEEKEEQHVKSSQHYVMPNVPTSPTPPPSSPPA